MIKNKPFKSAILAGLLAVTASSQDVQAQFSHGNVVVLQAGDGSSALPSSAAPVFLKEFLPAAAAQASPVSTVVMPLTGAARLTVGGTATSEGHMTLSADSSRLVIAGYDTASTAAAPSSVISSVLTRVVDTVSYLGIPGRAVSTGSTYSNTNFRSAAKGAGENYWGSGGNSGTYYLGTGTPASVQTTVTNTRVILAANGHLYFSTASGTPGIYKIAGQPTATSAAASMIATGSASSPYGFAINAGETVAYISDDRAVAANTGGIYKWVLNGSTWTAADTLRFGNSSGTRSIAVDWSGTYPTVYATTTDNKLIRWNDSANFAHYYTVLATAPANTAFRSVALAPKIPCTNPVLAATVTNRTCTANGAVTLNVTGGTMPTTFAWTGSGGFTANTQNITNLQAGTYTVTATTPSGCVGTATATVANPAFPVSVTAGSALSVCQGDSVTLTANTGAGFTYQWSNAVGPIPGATNAVFKAGENGTYTVTVSSGTNCTTVFAPAITITINPAPVVSIAASGPTSLCTGGSVQLCAAPAGSSYSYQWTLNGVPMNNITQCITATLPGTYCVKVTNTATGCFSSSCTVVTVGAPPAPITPAGPLAICPGGSVTLHTNNAAGLTYQWKVGGTNVPTAGNDSTYVVTSAGSYTVVVSAGSCSSTSAAAVVSTNPVSPATINVLTPLPTCNGKMILAYTPAMPLGGQYRWTFNGQQYSGSLPADSMISYPAHNNIAISNPVADTLRLTTITALGCQDSSFYVTTVRPGARAYFEPIRDTFCQMSIVSIAAAGTGAYRWFFAGSELSQTSAQIYADAGVLGKSRNTIIDSVQLIYQNTFGCIDTSAWRQLTFVPDPVPVITYNNGVLGTTIPYDGYQWYRNGVLVLPYTTATTYTPTADGEYNVLVVTRFGCTDTAAVRVTVTGLGVAHAGPEGSVKVYPNPAQHQVHISSAVPVDAVIYDPAGRAVLQMSDARDMDISGLAGGMYLLTLKNKEGAVLQIVRLTKAD